MNPYTADISNKINGAIIKNVFLCKSDCKEELSFLFPKYNNGGYTGYINIHSGTIYKYSFENDYLILEGIYDDVKIIFKRIE